MDKDLDFKKYTWDKISQFVTWEFCRNNVSIDSGPETTPKDIISYLCNRVLRATTKDNLTDVTKHEITAKFLEELNVSNSPEQFAGVLKMSKTMLRIAPELKPATSELLAAIHGKLRKIVLGEDCIPFQRDPKIRETLMDFSSEAAEVLPLPDILEILSHADKMNMKVTSTHYVKKRLFKKLSKDDIPDILETLDNDEMLNKFLQDKHSDHLYHANAGNETDSSIEPVPRAKHRRLSTSFENSDSGMELLLDKFNPTVVQNNQTSPISSNKKTYSRIKKYPSQSPDPNNIGRCVIVKDASTQSTSTSKARKQKLPANVKQIAKKFIM